MKKIIFALFFISGTILANAQVLVDREYDPMVHAYNYHYELPDGTDSFAVKSVEEYDADQWEELTSQGFVTLSVNFTKYRKADEDSGGYDVINFFPSKFDPKTYYFQYVNEGDTIKASARDNGNGIYENYIDGVKYQLIE